MHISLQINQQYFDIKQLNIDEIIMILDLLILCEAPYVKYANMEGFCRASH